MSEYLWIVSACDVGVTTEAEVKAFCRLADAHLADLGWEMTVRPVHGREIAGLYEVDGGRAQFLGGTYPVPDDLREATDVVWMSALEAM